MRTEGDENCRRMENSRDEDHKTMADGDHKIMGDGDYGRWRPQEMETI